MKKKKVLFVCSYNSVRSQIAHGLLKTIYPEKYEVFSAGIVSTGVNPHAVKVMGEIGVDISGYTSNSIEEYKKTEFDIVITVCDDANKVCPNFPGSGMRIHMGFYDPAKTVGTENEILEAFRLERDRISEWIRNEF